MRPTARRGKGDRGAAAVEAAFVFPILLLLIFAIIDFGRLLNTQLNVTEAAQQGARIASFGDQPRARVRELAGDEAAIGDLRVCAVTDGTDASARVTVTFPFEFVTPLGAVAAMLGAGGGGGGRLTVTGRGVMPCS
ncbi:TadE/TadG family type IV pilus assembly protein [Asanoa sp. NPDC050611]|uniref:TadE/TadG family type IV pilus assembly protein n=1 Tax=Asanoa sp. NPDC050611 TaxID=3157098 RepID=UPI0033C2C6BB